MEQATTIAQIIAGLISASASATMAIMISRSRGKKSQEVRILECISFGSGQRLSREGFVQLQIASCSPVQYCSKYVYPGA